MSRGPKKGSKQTPDHIKKRVENRVKWNGGHNLLTTSSFLDKLIEKWPDCPYDLSKVHYVKNDVKIVLVCAEHGDFLKWPSDTFNHSGCPKCAGVSYDGLDVISKLSNLFPNYDYSHSEFIKSTKQIKVRCKTHDYIFLQTH